MRSSTNINIFEASNCELKTNISEEHKQVSKELVKLLLKITLLTLIGQRVVPGQRCPMSPWMEIFCPGRDFRLSEGH